MQPTHIVEVFDNLVKKLSQFFISRSTTVNIANTEVRVPSDLGCILEAIKNDRYLTNPDFQTNVKTKSHEYAEFRHRYNGYVSDLHNIVLSQNSLFVRIVLDKICFDIFSKADLDWYGGLYHYDMKPIDITKFHSPVNDNDWDVMIDKTVRELLAIEVKNEDGEGNNAINESILSALLCRATTTLSFYEDVYLKNIFSADKSIKYVLQILLLNGNVTEELNMCPLIREKVVTILASLKTNQSGESNDMHEIEIDQFIFLLKHFMDKEESKNSTHFECPTLLFLFHKKKIKKLLDAAVKRKDEWFSKRPGSYLDANDKEFINNTLRSNEISDIQREGLHLGIGVHHNVSKQEQRYLSKVENLFAGRKLKFVIATGSLSYGINMPTANVIFLGASPHLDGMMFRQASGRAGMDFDD
jgi:hypothetical protein